MKATLLVLVLIQLLCGCGRSMQVINKGRESDTILIHTQKKGIESITFNSRYFLYVPSSDFDSTDKLLEWNPTMREIAELEKKLKDSSTAFPYPLPSYKRQYFGFISGKNSGKYIYVRLLNNKLFVEDHDMDNAYKKSPIWIYHAGKKLASIIYSVDHHKIIYLNFSYDEWGGK